MKILICDDHPLFRDALTLVLEDFAPDAMLLQADSGEKALRLAAAHADLDLVLLDLDLPGIGGFAALATLRGSHPRARIVIVSASHAPADIRAARDAGARAFIPKSSPIAVLRDALRSVREGGTFFPEEGIDASGRAGTGALRPSGPDAHLLTPKQRTVARLLVEGLTNGQIAAAMNLSENTVKTHLRLIFEALGARNRIEAVRMLLRGGSR